MLLEKILFLLCVFHATKEVSSVDMNNKCSNCIRYSKCPYARRVLNYASNKNNQVIDKLIELYSCGVDNNYDVPVMQVCCSAKMLNLIKRDSPTLPQQCGYPSLWHRKRRVLYGDLVKLYELPWMAVIKFQNENDIRVCGGSIINRKYILTAAHCIQGKHVVGVGVGYVDYSSGQDCEYINENNYCDSTRLNLTVEKKIVHPNYNAITKENDIALIRVAERIQFGKTIQPICLPVTHELRAMDLLGESVIVSGWGITETLRESKRLRKATVPVKQCMDFNKTSIRNTICAGDFRDTCNGDSGSPLFMKAPLRNKQRYVQFGITSTGARLCGTAMGVYTDVRPFMDWIIYNIAKI